MPWAESFICVVERLRLTGRKTETFWSSLSPFCHVMCEGVACNTSWAYPKIIFMKDCPLLLISNLFFHIFSMSLCCNFNWICKDKMVLGWSQTESLIRAPLDLMSSLYVCLNFKLKIFISSSCHFVFKKFVFKNWYFWKTCQEKFCHIVLSL